MTQPIATNDTDVMTVGGTNRLCQQIFEIDRLAGLWYNFHGQRPRWTTIRLAGPVGPPYRPVSCPLRPTGRPLPRHKNVLSCCRAQKKCLALAEDFAESQRTRFKLCACQSLWKKRLFWRRMRACTPFNLPAYLLHYHNIGLACFPRLKLIKTYARRTDGRLSRHIRHHRVVDAVAALPADKPRLL